MVDAHGAGATDGASARAAHREGGIYVLAHVDQRVKHRAGFRHVDGVLLEAGRAIAFRVEALDVEIDLHQYVRSFGSHCVIVTGW